ncbi:hypothetical protein BP00DRAFT_446298 [Aspergillus indologenus CBS 114.80]|uniref:D-isomer specific 2-hydroxyacid dehydrogenase NAD-binding domain-containing protein n=1 Tax=Aspergillus indologenus CBS 114.80 TaxID=1450541 RepID=A0A2V5I4I6_9EURO|nr:hypothetical protein BP00DRAFT_446298 [Aspergillus indologenus CBS 114.80]
MDFYPPLPTIQAEIFVRIPASLRCTGQPTKGRPCLPTPHRIFPWRGPPTSSTGICTSSTSRTADPGSGWLVVGEDGCIVVADYKQGLLLFDLATNKIGPPLPRRNLERFRGPNDLTISSTGDLYFTDQGQTGLSDPTGCVGSVEEVITHADVLSLHVPLTEETRGTLSYAEIKRMKPDAILINAARGGIVDEEGLERALSEGHLWGAGLDCHEQEPPSRETYGTPWENLAVISTPHIGAATPRAQLASATAAVDNLHAYLSTLSYESAAFF